MYHLLKINGNPPHLSELDNLTTYTAAMKKLSTYLKLMWLMTDDKTNKDTAGKIIGFCSERYQGQSPYIEPMVLDDDGHKIDGDIRSDVSLFNEIRLIKEKMDNFQPLIICSDCKRDSRNLLYSIKDKNWKFEQYACGDHARKYSKHGDIVSVPLKPSKIRRNKTLLRDVGMRPDVFNRILKSAGYDDQEINTAFAKKFILNLEKREPQIMSLFV